MHGFKDLLTYWLKCIAPKKIVEWGPGLSTALMLEHAPEASILSIEHDPKWHAKAQEQYGARVTLELHECTNRNSDYAACVCDRGPFDLAFVDGRRRVECAFAALPRLTPNGVLIIHDICRPNYTRLIEPFVNVVEKRANTAIYQLRADALRI
jgi:predicted O-methyltransferase YrrM